MSADCVYAMMTFACAQAVAIGNIALGAQTLLDVVDNVPKAPIVTVLGLIDHGRTSLLDAITSKQIARTEVGNITQCLRAHSLKYEAIKLAF